MSIKSSRLADRDGHAHAKPAGRSDPDAANHEHNTVGLTDSFQAVPWARGERITRNAVTVILAIIALCTFSFSFGNVWNLGLELGVPSWIAPLVGPAVDLSVVGLLLSLRYLSLCGVPLKELRFARTLLVFCGILTLVLNVASPVADGNYGRAAFDSVAPILLIGWAEAGPRLLRQIHATRRPGWAREAALLAADGVAGEQVIHPRVNDEADGISPDGCPEKTDLDLLKEAADIDAEHRREYDRPVAADTLRHRLGIGSARARSIVAILRSAS